MVFAAASGAVGHDYSLRKEYVGLTAYIDCPMVSVGMVTSYFVGDTCLYEHSLSWEQEHYFVDGAVVPDLTDDVGAGRGYVFGS